MNNQKSIDLLNSLVQINNDRLDGYEHAIKETDESDLKNLFTRLSATSRKCNNELITEVGNLGGKATEGTTASGKLYRIWMDVKAAATKKDRKAILNSCEYGEDWAVKTYKTALNDTAANLPSDLKQMVRDQYEQIRSDHDKVKNLRDLVAA
jgi:uncharacterized protein (TIGR02284 family)